MKLHQIVLEHQNKYLITLDKLFAGVKSTTSSSESTVIRSYQDFKRGNPLDEFYGADDLMQTYFEKSSIVLYCVQLLENAIDRDLIKPNDDIEEYLDLDILSDVQHDEEELHQFLYRYFQKIELPDEL